MIDRPQRRRTVGRTAGLIVAVTIAIAGIVFLDLEEAQARGNHVEFSVAVDAPSTDDDSDADMRGRRQRVMAQEAADRIELRLEAIKIKSHEVSVDDQHNIHIKVYGSHSAAAIKSAIIPSGRLEIRPVLVDNSPWLDISDELPDEVELRNPRGSFQTDRIYLFAHSPSSLRQVINRVAIAGVDVEIFPDDDGWRTINLGEAITTHHDVESVEMRQTPSGIPFVSATLSADGAQNLRSQASSMGIRNLAIVLDGEVVALQPFSSRQYSETMDLDPPDHLQSNSARKGWALQVTGRLAVPIPVRLVEN